MLAWVCYFLSKEEINKGESHKPWELPQMHATSKRVNLTQCHVILCCKCFLILPKLSSQRIFVFSTKTPRNVKSLNNRSKGPFLCVTSSLQENLSFT